MVRLRKLADSYDPTDKLGAMSYLQERQAASEVVTGLLYLKTDSTSLHERLNTVATPLNALGTRDLCPGASAMTAINAALR
jgi:2-oxoglutarate ferredoxin oxidoreductase subunit beta